MRNIFGACVTHAEIARAGFFPYQWRNQNVLWHVPILSHYSKINYEFPNRMTGGLKKNKRRNSLAASSLGPRSPTRFSTREPSEARLTSETSRISRTVFLCLHLNRVFWALTFKESVSDLLLVFALMWSHIWHNLKWTHTHLVFQKRLICDLSRYVTYDSNQAQSQIVT